MSSQLQHFGTQLAFDFRFPTDSPHISPESGTITLTPSSQSAAEQEPPLVVNSPAGTQRESTEMLPVAVEGNNDQFDRQPLHSPPKKDRTASELLESLAQLESPPIGLPTMRTAIRHACHYLGVAPEQCSVQKLRNLNKNFALCLQKARYSRNAARSYLTHVRMFVRAVDELGWSNPAGDARNRAIEESWREISIKIAGGKYRVCRPIITYALQQGKLAGEFGDPELDAFASELLNQRRRPQYIRCILRQFRKAVERLKLTGHLPRISPPDPCIAYGVPFDQLPHQLRNDITVVLAWKQAAFAPGRSNKKHRGRHRPVTAKALESFFCRLYGFVVNILPKKETRAGQALLEPSGESPRSLVALLTAINIREYSAWFVNELGNKSSSLAAFLVMLPGVFRHPLFNGQDTSWLQGAINDLPADPQSAIQEAKNRKWVEFPRLRQIPKDIHALRLTMAQADPEELAAMARNELLMSWLTHLPWRQKNIRECKLASRESGGNLYKECLPGSSTMDVPAWVSEALKENPNETFWQVFFRENEVKMGSMTVQLILPRALIGLLEEYLQIHRPVLLKGRPDPGTLFLTNDGKPFYQQQVTELVKKLTYDHTGRSVNPHLYRDAFAVYWLKRHPAEIVVVSKALWHMHIQTTIRKYAWAFDASHAQSRIEESFEKEDKLPNDDAFP